MRADENRGVPIPAHVVFAFAGHGADADALAGLAVVADEAALLARGVNNVGIVRIDAGLEAIAAIGDEPIGVGDAVGGAIARRAAQAVVILRAAIDVVEGRVVIDRDVVELGDGQIGFEMPVGGAVETFVDAAVIAHEVVVRVVRVNPQRVVIDVHETAAQRHERRAAIVAHHDADVHGVNAIFVFGVDVDGAVVHGGGVVGIAAFPRGAAIGGAENAAAAIRGFDLRVKNVGIGGSDGQADAAHFAVGKAVG